MVKKLTSCLLLLLSVIPAVHAQGDIIFSFPVLRNRSDTVNFRLQLADSLRVRYGMDGGQAVDYSVALFKLYAVPDSIGTYSAARLAEHAAATKEAFIRETAAIMDARQFPVWERDLGSSAGEIAASQVFSAFGKARWLVYKLNLENTRRLATLYDMEKGYASVIGNILSIGRDAAWELFHREHILRNYVTKNEIRFSGLSPEHSLALGMCMYDHERELYEIEKRDYSDYLTDILRQNEDGRYRNAIIAAIGQDAYKTWRDHCEFGLRRYEVSEDKLEEFRRIQKQLEIDRIRINRTVPELSDEVKGRMIKAAEDRSDEAMRKLNAR